MSDKKAAIVERFNRTLKTMMWKYFYSKVTYNWVDVLDELTENYNGTKHGSTLMKQADVNSSNKDVVWVTLYGSALGELPLPKFRVGDTVRVSRYKSVFGKEYEANFTEEIFKVTRVLRRDPKVYELEDHGGEPIVRKFYEEELSAVEKKDDTYRVEKVLRKKNGMALVKWLGYDSRSWVPLESIQNVLPSKPQRLGRTIKIWVLKNSRGVTSVATWKRPGETTRLALPARDSRCKESTPAWTRRTLSSTRTCRRPETW